MSHVRGEVPFLPGTPWAVCLGKPDAGAVGRLRQVAGIEVCELSEEIWLRGPALDENLHPRLAALPGARRFYVLTDGQLRPVSRQIPKGWLPKGRWVPLREWLAVELPPARMAGRSNERVPLVLARSARPASPSVLLTTVERWEAYASGAPQVRLDCLEFALAKDGRVVVRGEPSPPIAGSRWVQHDGIAVPAGWFWSPPVEAAVVRAVFGLEPGDVAFWQTDGTWQRIGATDFVRAGRSAARASAEGFRHAAQ